jgi:hypothetical protein
MNFTYDGRPRRWYRAIADNKDGAALLAAQLSDLYGARAQVIEVRPATAEEEARYVQGTLPRNNLCPTGRRANVA